MSILYDDMQIAIATEADRVLAARTDQERLLALLEEEGQIDEQFWQTVCEQGWAGIAIPEEYGGLGLGLVELGIVAEACGTHLSGAPFLTTGQGVAAALLACGSETLKQNWLPRLASGEVRGCVALAEGQAPVPSACSVTFANGQLTGTKPAVPGALGADLALVLANDNGSPVLLLAELGDVERHWFDSFDNTRATADIQFDGAPAEVLAVGDAARAAALAALAQQAVVAAHEQTGGAAAMMHRARDYALSRRAFGQPIGGFQSVKHRIAELYCLTELARANVIHAASRSGNADFVRAAAAARLSASEAYDTAARDCIQIHGGMGVTWESGLHLHMRRARSLAIETGNSLFWEDILSDLIVEGDR